MIRSVILTPGAVERLVKLGWPGLCVKIKFLDFIIHVVTVLKGTSIN